MEIDYRERTSKFTCRRLLKIPLTLIALITVILLATELHSDAWSTQGPALDNRSYTPQQSSLASADRWRASDCYNGAPTRRSAGDFPAGQLLTEMILDITGINKSSVVQLLNETLTERSNEAWPLLTALCDFASQYKCPGCVDSRSLPKTALDPRIRLNHEGTWKGYQLPIIFIRKIGRLGNLMSQYATALALKKIYNVSVVLSPEFSTDARKYFKGKSLPVVEEFEEGTWTKIGQDFRKKRKFQALELAAAGLLGPKRFKFIDYVLDMVLFNAFKDDVRKEFAFHDSTLQKAAARLQSFKNTAEFDDKDERMTAVGVHVRLTDYPHHMDALFDVKDLEKQYESYLRRAVDFFTARHSNLMFVVTSDNTQATTEIFDRLELRNVFVSRESPEEDMCLLTLCDHNIITFGSYGFWAAYLGRGTTVYPDLNDTTLEYPHTKRFYENAQIKDFVPVIFR